MALKVGDTAPDFTAQDQFDREHALSNYKGRWVVLYFYPKDDTPGCTKEACTFRDNYADYKKIDVDILGVSPDPVSKHEKFSDKYELPFNLIADPDKEIVNDYGVWAKKKFMGREYMGVLRWTYLIDPDGKIAKIYEKVKPTEHAGEILADLKELGAA